MKQYIMPIIKFDILENDFIIMGSCNVTPSYSECSHCDCQCVSRDNPHQNFGCNGCLGCSGGPYNDNHACNN